MNDESETDPMNENRTGFLCKFEWCEAVADEPAEVQAAFFQALCAYAKTGEKPTDLPAEIRLVFKLAVSGLDADAEKFRNKCERNRERAMKRWNTNDAGVCQRVPAHQNDANDADTIRYDTIRNDKLNTSLKEKTDKRESRAKPTKGSEAFEAWWLAYPNSGINEGRRVNKPECWRKWQAKGLDAIAERLMAATRYWARLAEADARKGNAHGIVMTTTFLNQERWNDAPEQGAPDDAEVRRLAAAAEQKRKADALRERFHRELGIPYNNPPTATK